MESASGARVKILLSVRDGERWLDELLRSIRGQQHQDWVLVVRDDGSSDSGMDVVAQHAGADRRIEIVHGDDQPLGPSRSFMSLLDRVEGDELFAFCDQDDVWLPHKLSWTVDAMARCGRALAAVATDAEVVDARGRLLAPSALAAHGVGSRLTVGRLLVNNVVIGATLVGTGDLARTARRLQGDLEPIMHDWWCALIAAFAGDLHVLTAPTLQWRRHGGTVTGHRPDGLASRVERRVGTLGWSIRAARVLASSLDPVDPEAHRAVAALGELDPDAPGALRLLLARRAGIRGWTLRQDLNLVVALTVARNRGIARRCPFAHTTERGHNLARGGRAL